MARRPDQAIQKYCGRAETTGRAARSLCMEQRNSNPFRDCREEAGTANVRLVIARNLARIYSDVLKDPLPDDLQALIDKWEGRDHRDGLRQN